MEKVVTLDFARAPGAIDLYPSVVRIPDGYIVAGVVPRYQVFRFDSAGRFLQAHGVYGAGPEEFRDVANVVVVGDSIWILDQGNNRCAIADPDLRPQRTMACAGYFSNVLPSSPGIIAQGPVPTSEHRGYHLRRISPAGEVHPFAAADTTYDLRDHTVYRRAIARTGDSVWLARSDAYDLELWHHDAGLVRSIHREPPWMDPATFVTVPDGFSPAPVILGLFAESDSVLWVAATTFLSDPPPIRDEIDPLGWHEYMATTVEVIDSRSGDLLAATRLDDVDMLRSIGGGLWSATRDAGGIGLVDVYRLRVVREQ